MILCLFCWRTGKVMYRCPFFPIFYRVFLSRYGPTLRASMGKYAMHHGVAAAARHFSHKLGVDVSTSTIHSIKSTYKSYIETLKRGATDEGDQNVFH